MAEVSLSVSFEDEATTQKTVTTAQEDSAEGDTDGETPPAIVAGEGVGSSTMEEQLIDGQANGSNTTGDDGDDRESKRCCNCLRFGGVQVAQGYNLIGSGRGCLVMANIFLATALTYLASEEAGCLVEENGEKVVEPDCDEKVFGAFRPASLITNIAVIWGLLAALFMPVIGAVIDYSPHRWKVGVGSAMFLIAIQLVQIGVGSSTWFYMAMLQALSGFLYQVQNLTGFAYLPDIARIVGEEKITQYMPTFTIVQFSSQALFLIMVVGVSLALGFGDVQTARLGQVCTAVAVSTTFFFGWKLLPQVPARHTVPEGRYLLTQGFVQNWNTAKEINQNYKKGLRWFLLSVIFGDASANAFTIVSVVFLDERLGLAGNQVGIFFLLALFGMIPGGKLAQFAAARTNPKMSWLMSMVVLFAVSTIGALLLDTENAIPFAFVWGFVIGILLGWYYPTERMILSLIVPKGKEAEISGFFIYCTQILGWLPPLVFSLLVESNVDQGIGVMCISAFLLIAITIMSMSAPWREILEEVAMTPTEETTDKKCSGEEGGKGNSEYCSKTEMRISETAQESINP